MTVLPRSLGNGSLDSPLAWYRYFGLGNMITLLG